MPRRGRRTSPRQFLRIAGFKRKQAISVCNHPQLRSPVQARSTRPFHAHDWPGRCLDTRSRCLSRSGASFSATTTRWFERRNDFGCVAIIAVVTHQAGRSIAPVRCPRRNRNPHPQERRIQDFHCRKPNTDSPHDAPQMEGNRSGVA